MLPLLSITVVALVAAFNCVTRFVGVMFEVPVDFVYQPLPAHSPPVSVVPLEIVTLSALLLTL